MPVIRASCLNPAPWSHNPFMILFRCFFSKFWTDQNRPLIYDSNHHNLQVSPSLASNVLARTLS